MDKAMKKCLIIVGGEYAPFTEDISFDYVIACDKGYEYADKMGIQYDIVIGDFDSAASSPNDQISTISLPAEKDDTDTMYAVKYALKKGFRDIYIICAFGGRLDHTIANIQTARFIASKDALCHLYGKSNELHAFKDRTLAFERIKDAYISVFSISEMSYGVTISGTKYTTDKISLSDGFPLGVSNEWISNEALISVENGILCVVISKKDQ